ncbi:MAG: DUF4091 domain-containing protein [Kiritimatiellae bacterium]|nr:DUF4091 domain-containing protein [Kiritimatiellia bacterium]
MGCRVFVTFLPLAFLCVAALSAGAAELRLAPGERVEGNVYYYDLRWEKRVWGGDGNALVRTHELGGGRRFTGGRVVVWPDKWQKGDVSVEVSGDGKGWHLAGPAEKGKFLDTALPAGAFPCDRLFVRFRGEKGAAYGQYGYSLDLDFDGPSAWATSSTNAFYTATSGTWLADGIWTVDSLRKVPRFGALPLRGARSQKVAVALAANETEAVQVVVSPERDVSGVRVDISVEGGLEAEALFVDWRRVVRATDASGATGFWPDPIRPQKDCGLHVPGGSNRSFWIRVRAPAGTRKGIYHGEISVSAAGEEARRFPLEVEVFGFELPVKPTCLTSFNCDDWKLRKAQCDVGSFAAALDRHHMMRFGQCVPYKYVFDEPTKKTYPEVRELCEKSKREHPELKRMVTIYPSCPDLVGYVDIWCTPTHDYSRAAADAARARGEDVWWYICCKPKAPYAGIFIDHPGTEMRTWLWQTWHERVTGVLVWHTHWWSNARGDNGDGTLFYRGGDGKAVDSFRAEAFRDGVEDYEYMALFTKLSGWRYEVPQGVSRTMTDFDRTGAALLSARVRLAREIERFGGTQHPRRILIAGDSLLEQRAEGSPYGSWGQNLAPFLADGVEIVNHAKSGASTKSFIDSGRWDRLMRRVGRGDAVIVQFGHNDVSKDPGLHTDIATFGKNFERFADGVRSRGATAVFVSPTSCYTYNMDGRFAQKPYIAERARVMKEAAEAKGAWFVDMSEMTERELAEKGAADTRCYYLMDKKPKADSMHTSPEGAKRFARLFAERAAAADSPLAKFFDMRKF